LLLVSFFFVISMNCLFIEQPNQGNAGIQLRFYFFSEIDFTVSFLVYPVKKPLLVES
jgi:hypothetical protein